MLNKKPVQGKPDELDLHHIDIETVTQFDGLKLSEEMAEDFNKLGDNILALNIRKRMKTIGVSSAASGEGSSTVAFNLAVTLAKNKAYNVLLIDGNLRNPFIHSIAGLKKENGLTEMILGKINVNKTLKKTPLYSLFLMTSGNNSVEPHLIYTPERFKDFVNMIENHFDYVIIDSPPINEFPDAAIMSSLVDGIILVIQAERVIYEIIQKAKEKIESSGGTIIGAVLNRRKYYIPKMLYKKL